MSLRSRQTHWFEAFVRREQVVYALEALASTYSVELELDSRLTGSLNIRELSRQLREFEKLAAPYADMLPPSARQATRLRGAPDEVAKKMVLRLRRWIDRITPLQADIESLKARTEQLNILKDALAAMDDAATQLPHITQSSELLYKALYACPSDRLDSTEHEKIIEQVYKGKKRDYVIVACLAEKRPQASQALAEAGCEPIAIPEDIAPTVAQQQRRNQSDLEDLRLA